MTFWRRCWQILSYLSKCFFDEDCANRAAALTYATLLSIVPMMMFSFWILSLFPVFKGTWELLQDFIVANFIADSANVIAQHLQEFLKQISALSLTNLIFLLGVGILMIYNMVHAFNCIWHVKMHRHFAVSFLLYLIVLLFSPLLFGAVIVMSSYLASLPFIASLKYSVLAPSGLHALSYFFEFAVFTFFNWALPSCKVPLRAAIIAGFITTIFFELAKHLFVWYISFFPAYRLIYGALATIPIFLMWIYICWVIILLGAIICHTLVMGIPKEALKR